MRNLLTAPPVLAVAAALLIGCQPPSSDVRHPVMSLPISPATQVVQVMPFTVHKGADERFGQFVTGQMIDRLGASEHYRVAAAGEQPDMVLGGDLAVETTDVRSKRTIRHWAYGSNPPAPMVVETLVRTAKLRVNFALTDPRGGHSLGSVEIRRTYDSAKDPAVRGGLGLARPDDPDRVPLTEQIVQDLLTSAAGNFMEIFEPVYIEGTVAMKDVGGSATRRGFAAVRSEEWDEAIALLTEALAESPQDPKRLYNLGGAEELAGRFEPAMIHYSAADKAAEEESELQVECHAALLRVSRVLQRDVRNLPELKQAKAQ